MIDDDDDEPTAAERAHAKTFGDLVDKTLAGRTPPAMSADDRALLEVATVIRAAHGKVELSASRQKSAIEDALRTAVGGAGASTTGAGVIPIGRKRSRAPWIVAAASLVAAAAAILLWLSAPKHLPPPTAALPTAWKSRPADALIGVIAKDRAGEASTRLDTIFADRMDGYRDRRLAGGKP
jgi:hypothetical protein